MAFGEIGSFVQQVGAVVDSEPIISSSSTLISSVSKCDWWMFIITAIIGLSGWVKFVYDRWTSKPRIEGKILNVMIGRMPNPEQQGKYLTSFLVFLYLTNLRKSSVHMLDYEIEIDPGQGFERLKRVYGIDKNSEWAFFDSSGEKVDIKNFQNNLIYKKPNPVEFGSLYLGHILFAGEESLYKKKIKRYKVTCIDALGGKHRFVSTPKEFCNLYLLQELAGIKFPYKKH